MGIFLSERERSPFHRVLRRDRDEKLLRRIKRDVAKLRLYEKGCGIIYGVGLTFFTAAESEGQPWVAMKKLWSYMLRYIRPVISADLGPKVGRPRCKKTTTTTRPTLVLA